MLAILRLPYVHSFTDKTGRVRYYFRHRGKRWPLPGQPGSSRVTRLLDLVDLCGNSREGRVAHHSAPHAL